MKKELSLIMTGILILMTLFPSRAQQFHPLSTDDGLSDNFVSSLTQDRDGYIWFATLNGLDRFDGYSFRQYTLSAFDLHHNSVSQVAADGGGHLWCHSAGGGFFLYDQEKDGLTDDYSAVFKEMSITVETPEGLFVDQEGNLWVYGNGELQRHDFSKNQTAVFPLDGTCSGIASRNGLSFSVLSSGVLLQLEPENRVLREGGSGDKKRLYLDALGRLWLMEYYSSETAWYDTRAATWNHLPAQSIPAGDYATSIAEDKQGNLWIGTSSSGILLLDQDLKLLHKLEYDNRDDFTLPSNHINDLYPDNQGTVWVAMSKKGVAFTTPGAFAFEKTGTGLSEDVGTIVEDPEGNIWVGYDGKGLFRYRPAGSGQRTTAQKWETGSNNVIGSFVSSNGKTYFCTYGDGIFVWDGKAARPLKSDDTAFCETVVRCRDITEDALGSLWIQTFSKGIVRLDQNGDWSHFHSGNSVLRSSSMTSMSYSAGEDLLFVSTNENLYAMNIRTLSMEKVYDLFSITNIFCDGRGVLWIGTNNGLYYIDRLHKKDPVLLSEREGLAGNYVLGICEDRNGNIWVTSNKGVSQLFPFFDTSTNSLLVHCFPYTKDDGLGNGQFTKNALCCLSSGDILMGYGGNVIRISPGKYAPEHSIGQVVITEAFVSDQPVQTGRLRKEPNIRMKYSDRLMLAVSSLDFRQLNKIRYEYRLDWNGGWTPADGNRIHLFCPSGKHQVTIRAAGPAATHSKELVLDLIVKPPFWKSNWAYLLYGLFILLMTSAAVERILYQTRKTIATERMEANEAKLQFFTNLSHDIRTPLTLIITPVSRLLKEHQGEPLEEDLQLIRRSALTLMDEVNQLLDFRKLDQAVSDYHPTYGDIGIYLKTICSSFKLIGADDSIQFEEHIPEEPLMMDFDKAKIQRIVYNLLSNAFKYNRPGGRVELVLEKQGDEKILLQVKDTGLGISDKDKRRVFERFFHKQPVGSSLTGNGIGLHIVQEYVSLHGGNVTVKDNTPTGTVFSVQIPIRDTMKETLETSQDSVSPTKSSGKPSILVVEDNEAFRTFLLGYLGTKYDAVGAENGKVALELLHDYPFDIIVSDVMMPEMDGLQLCSAIKGDIRYSHIPIILLSALQNRETIKQGLSEGADEYITKPFDIEILDIKLEKILAWTRQNHEKIRSGVIHASEVTVSRLDEQLLEKAVSILTEHLGDSEFSVEDLGKEIGISRSGLYKKLTFITGKTPIEFIRLFRLRKGLEMLEGGETSISQISWSVGFSPKQFSKYFKEEYGCLPSDYVKHLKG